MSSRRQDRPRPGALMLWLWTLLMVPALDSHLTAQSLDVDGVVANAVEALGGADAWQAVDSMEISGDYSTFSTTYPFRIQRQRPNLYRFEHHEADMQVVVGFDGNKAWWHNQLPLFAGVNWPTAPSIPYARGFEADAEFAGWPFLDAAQRGHRMTYAGIEDYEGISGHAVHMELAGGGLETWFFHVETFLPAVRVTKAGYVGREVDSRTFFDDYRPVGEVMMPYLLEFERGNLFAEMIVQDIRLNVPFDADDFAFPRPPLMQRLAGLQGRWDVTSESRPMPNLPWMESRSTATIETALDGRILREELFFLFAGRPRTVFKTFTFDRFTETFKIVQVDDLTAHPNIFVGPVEAHDGRFILSNQSTGTAWSVMGPPMAERQVLEIIDRDHFKVTWEQTPNGQVWIETARFDYRRQPADAGTEPR